MSTRTAPDPDAARRRVEMWRLRRAVLYLHDAAAVVIVLLAASIGSWLPVAAALLSLTGSLAYRFLDVFRRSELADLRAAGLLLTPAERARALACLGVRDAAEPAGDPHLEDLRRHLRDLPGGVRAG
ncbi:MAG TPA: hypothetical protein VHF51_07710 [Solirubrobacteraceae bacterium]|nr:hypothetical protein [Solirubrobacteraceae bacterium]